MGKRSKEAISSQYEGDNRMLRCGAYKTFSDIEGKNVIVCRRTRRRSKCGICPHRKGK